MTHEDLQQKVLTESQFADLSRAAYKLGALETMIRATIATPDDTMTEYSKALAGCIVDVIHESHDLVDKVVFEVLSEEKAD